FYVYPLKFLFTLAVGGLTGLTASQEGVRNMILDSQVPDLFVVYSIGYTAVFLIFVLLYQYAYRKRVALQLNEYETLRTRRAVINHLGFAFVGGLGVAPAVPLPPHLAAASGYLFCLNGVHGFAVGAFFGKKEKMALQRSQAEVAGAAHS